MSRLRWARLGLVTAVCLFGLTVASLAQQPNSSPGLLDALGRFFQESAENLKSGLKGTQDNLNQLGNQAQDAAKDTADSVVRLPKTRVVTGRARCVMAANGAPDCLAAAEMICKANGLPTGKSLDIESAEDCPVQVWALRQPGECKLQTYVTRAICQ